MDTTKNSLNFNEIKLKDKELFKRLLPDSFERGCEFSYANLYLWGQQKFVVLDDHIILFSQFDRRSVYPFPIGQGNKKPIIDAIINDAKSRGIACRIIGLSKEAEQLLEELYPKQFSFHYDEGSFDYIYKIEDLAELKGKKYHSKRNHIHRFLEEFPNYYVEPLCESNVKKAKEMVTLWYDNRKKEDPNGDYFEEETAIKKAFQDYEALGMEGLLLFSENRVLAVTMGSQMTSDTFDIHFEKAYGSINGAYAMINREFARWIQKRHPQVKYLNREEDMGFEGLRKAKQSYYPCRMMEKCWAHYLENDYEN